MNRQAFFKILRNKQFLHLWLAHIASQVSAYLLNFTLMAKIYEITHSTTALSIFLIFYTAPSIFLGLFAGTFVDFWSRRRVMLFSDLCQGVIALFYLAAGSSVWPFFMIVFLYSLCDEFIGPAGAALLPSLVKKEQLTIANTLFLFTGQGAMLAGSLLSGPATKYLHPQAPFILASLFLFFGAFQASRLPVDSPGKKVLVGGLLAKLRAFVADVTAGYRFIRATPRVLYPLGFYVLAQMLFGTSFTLFPSLASDILRVDPKYSGWTIVLPVGLGAVSGSLFIHHRLISWGRKKLISSGWLLVGFSLLALSLFIPRLSQPLFSSLLFLFLLGFGTILVITTSLLMVQENTPSEIRGRVFGALGTLVVIFTYLPVFFLAAVTDLFGIAATLFLAGFSLFILGLISFKIKRKHVLGNRHRS